MTQASELRAAPAWASSSPAAKALASDPVRQAFGALRIGFTIAPIVMGLDKFTWWLVDWNQYLAPSVVQVSGLDAHTLLRIVGVIEIVAGIGVAVLPWIFSWVVLAWLVGIIGNLLALGGYYDIAVRDLGLAIGAFALARLSQAYRAEEGAGLHIRSIARSYPGGSGGAAIG